MIFHDKLFLIPFPENMKIIVMIIAIKIDTLRNIIAKSISVCFSLPLSYYNLLIFSIPFNISINNCYHKNNAKLLLFYFLKHFEPKKVKLNCTKIILS